MLVTGMPGSPQTPVITTQSPSGSGSPGGTQQASWLATRVTVSDVGMSQRVWKTFSLTMDFAGPPAQAWVTLKMMSGVQSNQGVQGYQGQRRRRSSSGTWGNTPSSLSRRSGITAGS